jgi:mRNA interferase RelE/StbE
MKLVQTRRFEKQLVRLVKYDRNVISTVQKTLDFLMNYPPPHPSLRMKRIQGTDKIYECSVNMDIRITFEFGDKKMILLRNIDHHDDALRKY